MAAVILLLAFLLFIGIVRSQLSLMMVCILLIGASVVFALWSQRAVNALTYRRSFDPPRIFPGEETDYVVEITNRSWMPIPWVRIYERFPAAITVVRQEPGGERSRGGQQRVAAESWQRRRTLSLAWRERLVIRERMTCAQRGHFTFGPTDLETGDPTGLFAEQVRVGETRELIVYPQLATIPSLRLESTVPFGTRKAPPPTLEDPAQFAGIRDYRPGDPRRWVDWKASARRMRLQTRVFTPSTLDSVVVALNVQTMEHAWQGYDAERFEEAVSVAAAVVEQTIDVGHPVGLAVNGSGTDTQDFQIFLPPNRRPAQLEDALALLAQLAPIPTLAFPAFLRRIAANFPYGTGLIVVTAYLDDTLADELEALTHWGHRISILFVGSEVPVDVDPRIGVTVTGSPTDTSPGEAAREMVHA
jgi:uncharacterized protein (DUF58 family)